MLTVSSRVNESSYWHKDAALTEILSENVGNVGHKGNVAGQFHAFCVCVCVLSLCVCGGGYYGFNVTLV